jgi:hypothetical protein
MGIAFKETHDCHQKDGVCFVECCPISRSAPVDMCPKTHTIKER